MSEKVVNVWTGSETSVNDSVQTNKYDK